MSAVENIVAAHLDTWNTTDRAQRAQSIASIYSSEVFIGEPQEALRGHAGMEQAIARLQAQIPDSTIARSGPIEVAQDLVTYRWALSVGDGAAVAAGRDVLIIRDDLITSVYVLIDAP